MNDHFACYISAYSHKPEEEEITSESDADSEEDGEGQKKQQHHAAKRKLKMDDYPEFLAKRHKCFEQYRYCDL